MDITRARRSPHYIGTMRARLTDMKLSLPQPRQQADKQWLFQQSVLQGLRERGWDVVLHEGDLGFYDETPGLVPELVEA